MTGNPRPTVVDSVAGRRASAGRWVIVVGQCVLVAVLGAACAKARAQTSPDGPPLRMPDPPPRVLVPAEAEPLAVSPVAPLPPDATLAPMPPQQPAVRVTGQQDEKPQPAPAVQGPPPPPAEPPRELRPLPSPRNAASERTVRETLARAARDLGRVEYGKLTEEGRDQYDQSRRFAQQAEQALRTRNVIFAATLADKAATLAAQLPGR